MLVTIVVHIHNADAVFLTDFDSIISWVTHIELRGSDYVVEIMVLLNN